MNIEHIEWQIIAALIYLMYVIVMLLGNRSAGQKRKTVLIGFTPGLLAGVVFVAQYVLEIAYIDTSIPITLAQVFDSFYANLFILILLTGIISVGYLVLQGNVIFFRDIINNERNKQANKCLVISESDCIDASSDYLRKKRQLLVYEEEGDNEEEYGGYWGTGYEATGYEGTGYRSTGNGG